MLDVIDSYFAQVQAQMQNVDPTQAFGGIVNARDWPLTPPVLGALYLLVGAKISLPGGTASQELFEYQCQWTWLLVGTDIPQNTIMENRGDRYRASLTIEQNLRQANFPQWCQKKSATVNTQTGAVTFTPVSSTYPVSATEQITWSRIRFASRQDNEKTGVVYGVGVVSVFGYDDILASLAA
jgi:hypothetical protein